MGHPRAAGVLLAAALVGAGCRPATDAKGPPPAVAVVCSPVRVSLQAGTSIQLQAQANDATGRPVPGAPIAFKGGEEGLLHVSSAGLLTASGRLGATSVVVQSAGIQAEVPVVVTPGEPVTLDVAAGGGQAAPVAVALPGLIVVRALDGFGNPVPGTPVGFQTDERGGTAEPSLTVTETDGLAKTRWTLGPSSGRQHLRARAQEGAGAQVSIDATALIGPAARLEVRHVEVPAAPAGTPLEVAVAVLDAHGNAVPRAPVAFRVVSGGGSASPPAAFTAADGRAVSRWTLGARTARNELQATCALLPGRIVTSVTVGTPGSPHRVARITTATTAARLGVPITALPGVRVEDSMGNPVAGVPVRFHVASGSGQVEPAVVATDELGLARPTRWVACSVGTNSIAAEVEGLPVAVLEALARPAAGAQVPAACQVVAPARGPGNAQPPPLTP